MDEPKLNEPRFMAVYNAVARVLLEYERDIKERVIAPRSFRIEIEPAETWDTCRSWQANQDGVAPPEEGALWALSQFNVKIFREKDEFVAVRCVAPMPPDETTTRPWTTPPVR